MCRLFGEGLQGAGQFWTSSDWGTVACTYLSKEVHGGGFSKKLVNEVKTDSLHWVCSIPGMSPYWSDRSSVVHTEPEAEQGFLADVFPYSQNQWGDGLHWALQPAVEAGEKKKRQDRNEAAMSRTWGRGGSLEQRTVWVCSGENGMRLCNWGLYHNANIQGGYEGLQAFLNAAVLDFAILIFS